MAKKLIIAEKPSVAVDIARALGGFTRHGDYFESDKFVLSSAIGHLVAIAAPDQYEVKRGKWSLAHLPVIPPHFDLVPIERTEDRLKLLIRLMKRKDVTGLINACDAGREGELIFRYIVQHAGCKKPIQRLWLQSMTPSAILEGFASLRSEEALRALADAAVCRSESDWLIGINGTRAMTAFNSKEGGFYKTTVGRVQTPTLAILVEREQRIRSFVPRPYWELHGMFSTGRAQYTGRWFDEKFAKPMRDEDSDARPERIWSAKRGEALRSMCEGKPAVATEESKPTTQLSPLLFDLTSLQREANARFGFSAKMTLALAQALYEKHKALTYPRTDSRALPEDYIGTARTVTEMLTGGKSRKNSGLVAPYAPFAVQILKGGWIGPNRRVFDGAKVSDHFAIIPTLEAPRHLNEAEAKLYDMVVKRFLAVFFPPAEFMVTTRITRVEGQPFRTEGRVMNRPGWLAVYGRDSRSGDEAASLPPLIGPKVTVMRVELIAAETKAPSRFTEATLLSAMEAAGRLIDDEELREAMRDKGLGTPATRAAIIEGLIFEDYLHRIGRELQPTPKAFSLMFALQHFGINELTSPELTGNWEYKLKQMERSELRRSVFMDHIVDTTRDMVERIRHGDIPDEAFATLTSACPKCGGIVQENYRKFQCQSCDFAIWRVMSGRELAPEEAEQLIKNRVVGPLTGFRSRLGRPFAGAIKLSPEMKPEFDFGTNSDGGDSEAPDFSGLEPLGACPKCKARIFEQPMAYICEKSVGPQRDCDFRSGRIILQRPIERDQMLKLLSTGKTDLLNGFISKKGRRFSAYLVRGQDGTIGFEFAPRTVRSKAAMPDKQQMPTGTGKKNVTPRSPAKAEGLPPKTKAKKKSSRPASGKRSG